MLAFPWWVHAAVVLLSACSLRPLGGRGAASALLFTGVLASGGVFAWARPRIRAEEAAGEPRSLVQALALTIGIAGAVVLGWALLAAVAFPIVAYDALGYRIPAMASWLDAGRIAWVVTDDPVRNGYPLGQEAVAAVFAAAAASVRFTAAASFPYVAAGALALVCLAERCGVRRALAWAAGALFVLSPMVTLNAASGYVDAAFAGAMIALVCFAAMPADSREEGAVAFLGAGMAAAHVMSLKGNGVVFAGIVFAAVIVRALVARAWPRGVVLGVALALPGAFWLLRNVIQTGNPFWPVRMAFGPLAFPGVASLESVLDVVHNTPPELARLGAPARVLSTWFELGGPASDFDARLSGMGVAWVLVALPALLWSLLRLRPDGMPGARQRLGFVAAITALCFAIQPMNWWPRYTLWLWGAGALGVVFAAEAWLRGGSPRAVAALLALAAVLSVSEGVFAAAHANGAHTALQTHGLRAFFVPADPRRPANVRRWVDARFWAHGFENDGTVCRGYWKPSTDDANLDGVFAQLVPRVRVHPVDDDKLAWTAVRRAFQAHGCSRLLLFSKSPVLGDARRDPDVSIEEVVAFDPLFVVNAKPVAFTTNAE